MPILTIGEVDLFCSRSWLGPRHDRMVGCDQQQLGREAVSPWPYCSVCETYEGDADERTGTCGRRTCRPAAVPG
jgi:hypothetical protein